MHSLARVKWSVSGVLLTLALPLSAQRVVIKRATVADVVAAVNNELGPQGFKLEDTTRSEARWGLDRGLISQNRGSMARQVPVVLELHLRFKEKENNELQVDAYEEVVGARGQGNMEFRQPVRSAAERESMQRLLDLIKTDLEARPQTPTQERR